LGDGRRGLSVFKEKEGIRKSSVKNKRLPIHEEKEERGRAPCIWEKGKSERTRGVKIRSRGGEKEEFIDFCNNMVGRKALLAKQGPWTGQRKQRREKRESRGPLEGGRTTKMLSESLEKGTSEGTRNDLLDWNTKRQFRGTGGEEGKGSF